jgi:hypothetical protein
MCQEHRRVGRHRLSLRCHENPTMNSPVSIFIVMMRSVYRSTGGKSRVTKSTQYRRCHIPIRLHQNTSNRVRSARKYPAEVGKVVGGACVKRGQRNPQAVGTTASTNFRIQCNHQVTAARFDDPLRIPGQIPKRHQDRDCVPGATPD